MQPKTRILMATTGKPFSALPALVLCALVMSGNLMASPLSQSVKEALQIIQSQADHGNRPFIVLDKVEARLWVFDARGHEVATTPVLIGSAVGDDSVPGIGSRPLNAVLPHERTTPAGRFRVEPGRNLSGEDIFWVDYDAAISLHRMRASNRSERRPQRMASSTAADNRISYGCVNVPHVFYNEVIHSMFSNGVGQIYILPETRPIQSIFEREPSGKRAP